MPRAGGGGGGFGSQFKELGMMQVGPGGVRSPLKMDAPAMQGYDRYPQDAMQGYDRYPQEQRRRPQQAPPMPHGVDPRNYMSPRYMMEGPAPAPAAPWGAQPPGMPGYAARGSMGLPPAPQRLVRGGPPAHHQMPDYGHGAMPTQGGQRYEQQSGYESDSSDDYTAGW